MNIEWFVGGHVSGVPYTCTSATKLGLTKHRTSALATHHTIIRSSLLQLCRASSVLVDRACRGLAWTQTTNSVYRKRAARWSSWCEINTIDIFYATRGTSTQGTATWGKCMLTSTAPPTTGMSAEISTSCSIFDDLPFLVILLLRASWHEPQPPVAQVNLPEASVEHRVRPQTRPVHCARRSMAVLAFDGMVHNGVCVAAG